MDSVLHFTQEISEENDYQQEEHFVRILGVSEGVSLMASFWLQVEIGHLGPTPGLEKIVVSKNPQQSCDPTTLHLNGSLSARGNSSTFAFADPLSWPQAALAICPAQAQMCPQLSPVGCL